MKSAGRQETLTLCIELVGRAGHNNTMRTNRNKTARSDTAVKLGLGLGGILFHLFHKYVLASKFGAGI